MPSDNIFEICVLPGDGIGTEVTSSTIAVLDAVSRRSRGFGFNFEYFAARAERYLQSGVAMPDETWRGAEEAHAIFLGAMGLPRVRYDDGTEITPQLDLRFSFDLYAGVRPVSARRGGPPVLKDNLAGDIDFVLIRESTEGLFASCGKGEVIADREARDTMVITRERSRQVFEFAFQLARDRAPDGGKSKVTLVDKANIFSSMAFFRKVFDEVAQSHKDIETERLYVDACALDLVRRPWEFDVLVTENMFGDILSDLAAGLVGGMGFAPSADIGHSRAVFQPAHGSAPDIAGKGIANPTAAILSGAMMLDWLGRKHQFDPCIDAARSIEGAVEQVLKGGQEAFSTTAGMTQRVIDAIG